ncbi:MAG: RNA polymerase sigma factor [Patescibacteria group bacterium]
MQATKQIKEQILLLKIRHGDAGAYAQVYDAYVDAIFRFISFRVPNQDIAQDLTADVFLKVWERLSSGEKIKVRNLRAYFYQVARNLITDHYRQDQPALFTEAEADSLEQVEDSTVANKLTLAEIETALKKLKPDQQEIIILAHIEGFSLKEISVIIGKSHGAARVDLHRALKELKQLLQ